MEKTKKLISVTKEELKKLISEGVEKELKAKNEAALKKEKKQHEELNELETVLLVKDGQNYKDDVTITHNGVNYQIKRGIAVLVPKFLKLILEASMRQQLKSVDLSDTLSKKFIEKTKDMLT